MANPYGGGLLLVIDQNSTDQEFDEKIDTLLQELQNKTWLLSLKKPIIEDKCVLCDNYMFQQKMDVNRNKICNFCSCSFGHFNNIDNEFRLKIKECKNYKRPQ